MPSGAPNHARHRVPGWLEAVLVSVHNLQPPRDTSLLEFANYASSLAVEVRCHRHISCRFYIIGHAIAVVAAAAFAAGQWGTGAAALL